jgi:hypothetical protein
MTMATSHDAPSGVSEHAPDTAVRRLSDSRQGGQGGEGGAPVRQSRLRLPPCAYLRLEGGGPPGRLEGGPLPRPPAGFLLGDGDAFPGALEEGGVRFEGRFEGAGSADPSMSS